ncbi:unnamed protein product [Caenorhabditis auriculariae]|uniref:DMAP1-binding domain-containing protein n=1 Tax=Caenorhabditis auriculariae TaxID=2777116 RepID=A0A8S1HWX6_9PELO|nr:unnamed protein product [Caenorhabditis auriculariae]
MDGDAASELPEEVRERLAELEIELSEGDITQKGFDKKKARLLAPYANSIKSVITNSSASAASNDPPTSSNGSAPSPNTRANRRHQRRLTRDEGRYHSEIRAEAVHQALAEYSDGRKLAPQLVQPKRRVAPGASNGRKTAKNVLSGQFFYFF